MSCVALSTMLYNEKCLVCLHSQVSKGLFLTMNHFNNADNMKRITPEPVKVLRKLINHPLLRYGLIKTSIDLSYNIPWRLNIIISSFLSNHMD